MPAHRAAPHTVRAVGSSLYVATTASDSYRTRDEAAANARLIAAAPDMLAALRMCRDAERERRAKLLPGAPATTYTDARIAVIYAAIVKATGSAP
jgi:hypothetical protein